MRPTDLRFRPYREEDREACLALLRSNGPEHFIPSDEAWYAGFLDALPGPYFVAELPGVGVVGAGGMALEEDGVTATLCWGIVTASRHRGGIGSALLEHRIAAFVADHPAVTRLRVNTTQKVQRFFERHGFVVVSVHPQEYGPDLDHVTMERTLGEGP